MGWVVVNGAVVHELVKSNSHVHGTRWVRNICLPLLCYQLLKRRHTPCATTVHTQVHCHIQAHGQGGSLVLGGVSACIMLIVTLTLKVRRASTTAMRPVGDPTASMPLAPSGAVMKATASPHTSLLPTALLTAMSCTAMLPDWQPSRARLWAWPGCRAQLSHESRCLPSEACRVWASRN